MGEGLEADAHVVDVVLEHLWFRKLWITALEAGEARVGITLTRQLLDAGVTLCLHPRGRRLGEEILGVLVVLESCEWLLCGGCGGGGERCLQVLVS